MASRRRCCWSSTAQLVFFGIFFLNSFLNPIVLSLRQNNSGALDTAAEIVFCHLFTPATPGHDVVWIPTHWIIHGVRRYH